MIAVNPRAFVNTFSDSVSTLPIAILYVTAGCNLQCITCSFRTPLPAELTLEEIRTLAGDLKRLGLRHIVYSGGEPLLRRDFVEICETFKHLGVKQTLLTNGLLLEKRFDQIAVFFSEVIVSIDGPKAQVHNKIRGMNAFDAIIRGVNRAVDAGGCVVSIRTVLQRSNFRYVPEMLGFAKSLGVQRLSFLAADVHSDSFGRDKFGPAAETSDICLNSDETAELRQIVDESFSDSSIDNLQPLRVDSRSRLMHIVQYYEAMNNGAAFPNNICNAPMVSTVITSSGDVHPCYFLPRAGNIRTSTIAEILNSTEMKSTRSDVRAYRPAECKTCVCTLYKSPAAALFDRF